MKQKLFISLFALVLILTLSGCNSAKPTEDTNSSPSSKTDILSETTITTPSENQSVTETKITEAKAKDIAFAHAGVTAASVKKLEIELDNDDAVKHYEISFKSGNYEYEYDINAENGKIINVHKEIDD